MKGRIEIDGISSVYVIIDHANNLLAYRLGLIASEAGDPNRSDVGDEIDRGLILRRLLEESGFYLMVTEGMYERSK